VGTVLTAKLSTPIASDTSKVEDAVRGTLTKPLTVSGTTAVPAGAEIVGSVLDAKQSGRVKGLASIAFRFSRLIVGTEAHPIHTAQIARQAAPDRKGDVTKGAIGGGVGALVGGIVGGGKGAAIGAGVGGTGAVLATRGKEVRLPAGTVVSTHLEQALVLLGPGRFDRRPGAGRVTRPHDPRDDESCDLKSGLSTSTQKPTQARSRIRRSPIQSHAVG
jgi:hypothetical protein